MQPRRVTPAAAPDPHELVGCWSLRRIVTDETSGLSGAVRGALEISDVAAGLSWTETGQLSWQGRQAPITRHLQLWPAASGWNMHFSHGGYFHEWAPGREVTHQCRDDLYTGIYRITPARMDIVWTVVGPAKEHRYATVFER